MEKTIADLTARESERTLVVCDASRSDLLLGLSAAHSCRSGPHLAGVLVTDSQKADKQVARIIKVVLASFLPCVNLSQGTNGSLPNVLLCEAGYYSVKSHASYPACSLQDPR